MLTQLQLQKIESHELYTGSFFKMPSILTGDLTEAEVLNEHFHSAYVLKTEAGVVGRFALYTNDALEHESTAALCVGSYACIDDDYVASILLNKIDLLSAELGYKTIIGPINGSTWAAHRFSCGQLNKKFFLDTANPDYYNDHFISAGYKVISNYVSNFLVDGTIINNKLNDSYWKSKGLRIRNIDLANLPKELYKIAVFSNKAFSKNFLFTPIKVDVFVEKYLKLSPILNPDYIYLAEDHVGEIHGISFSLPDPYKEQTMIIKSIAIKSDTPYRGIGIYLSRKTHNLALADGYTEIIHAFMHTKNTSLNASHKYGENYKAYKMYSKQLK